MNANLKNLDRIPWKTIIGTVIACAAVFGFIYTYTINMKNAEISLLVRRVEFLSEVGSVPEAVKSLKSEIAALRKQLGPLSSAAQVDPLTGRCKFGSMDSPTDLSRKLSACLKLIDEKKYDLALSKAEEMDQLLPDFLGATYVRFLVNQAKNFEDEAAKYAITILEEIPKDNRIPNVYVFTINYNMSKGRKKEAEGIALQALELWPEDEALLQSFKSNFGYTPTKRSNDKTTPAK